MTGAALITRFVVFFGSSTQGIIARCAQQARPQRGNPSAAALESGVLRPARCGESGVVPIMSAVWHGICLFGYLGQPAHRCTTSGFFDGYSHQLPVLGYVWYPLERVVKYDVDWGSCNRDSRQERYQKACMSLRQIVKTNTYSTAGRVWTALA
ncbi:hypothetical protein IWX90DRAFT_280680 [Phyllosticta citrichinensis]|uniref:Uncharacterized protein n=1 Tax=Phyllosticta citrichinensis TaxID=1130410 RepID=A0ABR1XNK9_9PEZI